MKFNFRQYMAMKYLNEYLHSTNSYAQYYYYARHADDDTRLFDWYFGETTLTRVKWRRYFTRFLEETASVFNFEDFFENSFEFTKTKEGGLFWEMKAINAKEYDSKNDIKYMFRYFKMWLKRKFKHNE